MPELPEVETIARTLTPLVAGQLVTDVALRLPRALDAGSLDLTLLKGRRITGVSRRGKLALILLEPLAGGAPQQDEAYMLAVHLKMTGRLFVFGPEQQPHAHTRAVFELQGKGTHSRLFFDDARSFGYLRLVSPASMPSWPFWQKLGLEPLTHRPQELAARIGPKRGAIKALLLDQTLVAGIGNIYADEALFRAGLDPRRKADTIPPAHLVRLFFAVQEVLKESIEQCGSSIKDYRTARGDAGAFQNSFRVYGRGGQQCLACQSDLQSVRVAGRATVFCPRCQA